MAIDAASMLGKRRERNDAEARSTHHGLSPKKKVKMRMAAVNGDGSGNGSPNGNGNGNGKSPARNGDGGEHDALLLKRRELPIWTARNALVEAVRDNDTIVVLGETGSGKTTQLPQFLYEAGFAGPPSKGRPAQMIGITQPRRVAATSLAARVATEVGCEVGTTVGYSIRFEDRTSKETRIKFMTDGMVLRELLGEKARRDKKMEEKERRKEGAGDAVGEQRPNGNGPPSWSSPSPCSPRSGPVPNGNDVAASGASSVSTGLLERYSVFIIDEAHERTLRTDLVLGCLKDVQRRRKELRREWIEGGRKGREVTELKVVIMSATIDADKFSAFFNDAPILYVQGRQFPVQVLYAREATQDYIDAALKTVYQIHCDMPPGDVLVFLTGQEEIENVEKLIKTYSDSLPPGKMKIVVAPIFAALSSQAQSRVFDATPANTRKIVLATNIAETSITIPGIRYVVDTGYCKEKSYHSRTGVEVLEVAAISKSSAQQRAGRAGREGKGMCFRLYPEQAYTGLEASTVAEILRCNLMAAALELKALGVDPYTFDFMDRPDSAALTAAVLNLVKLGAVDAKTGEVTALGVKMSKFPLDPPLSRMLVASVEHGCTKELVDLVSLLSADRGVFTDSFDDRERAEDARRKFAHRQGDHLTLVNVLRAFESVEESGRRAGGATAREEVRRWCKDNFVEERAVRNAQAVRRQLRTFCEREGIDWRVSCGDEAEPVLRSYLAGKETHTALRQPGGSYKVVHVGTPIKIHPSSSMRDRKPQAIVFDELNLTSFIYARTVSAIEPSWLSRHQARVVSLE